MMLSAKQRQAIYDHCLREYPKEAVGVVIGPEGTHMQDRIIPCVNAIEKLCARDPGRHPCGTDARFAMDPDRLLLIDAECRAKGWRMKLIYHSHPDGGTEFSSADRAGARAHDGTPLHPHVQHMVLAVTGRAVTGHAFYRWDAGQEDFAAI